APVEETMEALHDVVKAGKARYIGASSMYAWQFAKLQHAADVGGWTRFRVDAEPVQPVAPPGRARADRDVRRHGHRSGSVLPAGQGPAGASLGRAEPALHGGQGRPVVRLTSRRAGRQGRAGGRRGAARDDGQVALAWVLSK